MLMVFQPHDGSPPSTLFTRAALSIGVVQLELDDGLDLLITDRGDRDQGYAERVEKGIVFDQPADDAAVDLSPYLVPRARGLTLRLREFAQREYRPMKS